MRSAYLLLSVLFLSRIVHAGDNTTDVPLAHRVYRTLDRYDARGWLDAAAPQTRPYTRLEVARLLVQVLQNSDAQAAMSGTERGILRRRLASFRAEAARLGHAPSAAETGAVRTWAGALYSWRDTSASVAVRALFRQRLIRVRGEVGERETVSQTHIGGIVRGTLGDRIGFRARHFEAREWSTLPRLTRADVLARPIERIQFKGKAADFREAAWQLVWTTRRFAADAAKGSLDWGPGRSGNLLLSPFSPTFGMARFRMAYRRVRFIHVLGFLEADSGLVDPSRTLFDNGHRRTFLRSKAIAAHRVEVDVSRRVRLGFQEAVIYGDRDFEFLYASPVSVLTAAQMAVGDRDNLAVGMDISFRPVERIQAYLAFFMDDMRKFSPGDFSNKFAAQAGVYWVDAFGLPDTDVRAEFAHIEPFVYSHRFNVNAFTHFDALLGYPSGPNSDRVWTRLTHRLSPSVSAALSLERTRQGENVVNADGTLTNVGGDARRGRRPQDPPVREFLSGTVEKRTQVGVDLVFEPLSDLVLSATYRLTRESNARGNGSAHDWRMTLDLNFF